MTGIYAHAHVTEKLPCLSQQQSSIWHAQRLFKHKPGPRLSRQVFLIKVTWLELTPRSKTLVCVEKGKKSSYFHRGDRPCMHACISSRRRWFLAKGLYSLCTCVPMRCRPIEFFENCALAVVVIASGHPTRPGWIPAGEQGTDAVLHLLLESECP